MIPLTEHMGTSSFADQICDTAIPGEINPLKRAFGLHLERVASGPKDKVKIGLYNVARNWVAPNCVTGFHLKSTNAWETLPLKA
jgi:hypothetical protein